MENPKTTYARLWRDTGRWFLAGAIVVGLQWAAVTGDGWVGLVSHVDLGFHELGHMLFMWAPPVAHAIGGTLLQAAVPLGLFMYFFMGRRDGFASALMLGWEAVALRNIAVYMADAPVRVLPLLGGQGGHDWSFLFSHWGVLDHAGSIAMVVKGVGLVVAGLGVGLAVRGLMAPRIEARRADRAEARLRALPVREPRNPTAPLVDVDE